MTMMSNAMSRKLDPLLPQYSVQLLEAVKRGNISAVIRLLERQKIPENLRVVNPPDGWTTLMLAALGNYIELFRFILEKGHDDEAISRDYTWKTILHIAAENGSEEIFFMYCERYPETIGLQDRSGRTPFILASMHGRDSQLEYLLDRGEDVDQTDNDGSKNSSAAAWGHLSTIDMLIRRGCRYTVRNKLGWTAADWSYNLIVRNKLEEKTRETYHKKPVNRLLGKKEATNVDAGNSSLITDNLGGSKRRGSYTSLNSSQSEKSLVNIAGSIVTFFSSDREHHFKF